MKKKQPDDRAALEEKFAAEFAAIVDKIKQNPNADGWLRLCEVLEKAKADKRIQSSPGALEFLGVVREIAADSFTCDEAIQAFRPLAPILAGDQLRDNSGRIRGGETMKHRKENHTQLLTDAVEAILKNPATSDWSDPDIARWLMKPERAFHERKGKTPLGLKTMTTRVKEIRAAYKASI